MLRSLQRKAFDEAEVLERAIESCLRSGPDSLEGIARLEELLRRYRDAVSLGEAAAELRERLKEPGADER